MEVRALREREINQLNIIMTFISLFLSSSYSVSTFIRYQRPSEIVKEM